MGTNNHPLLRPRADVVRAWSNIEAEQQVRDLLDWYARHALDNFDKLHRVGINLAGAGHHRADLWAVCWAAEDPNDERLEIASSLLWGLWNPRFADVHPTTDAVEELIALRERVHPTDGTDYVTLMALADAASVADVHQKVRSVLLAARARPLAIVDLNQTLQATISRVLGD